MYGFKPPFFRLISKATHPRWGIVPAHPVEIFERAIVARHTKRVGCGRQLKNERGRTHHLPLNTAGKRFGIIGVKRLGVNQRHAVFGVYHQMFFLPIDPG